ncbi:hypothetical protein KAR48_08555 [bacterium]|nr:hypothetical protein [bacterium]
MAKDQSFANKFARGTADFTKVCGSCGETVQAIKLITSDKSEKTGAWRFNQNFIGLCKCNEGDITG